MRRICYQLELPLTCLHVWKEKKYIQWNWRIFKNDIVESVLISWRMPSPWKTCQRLGTLHYAVFPRSNRSSSTHLHLSDTPLCSEGGGTRAFLLMWKKKKEADKSGEGMSGSNTRHRGGLLVQTESHYAFESLSVFPFHRPIGMRWTREEPQSYYMSVWAFWCLPSLLSWGCSFSAELPLYPQLYVSPAASMQTDLYVTTLLHRESHWGGHGFHKALSSINLAKFNLSTWLNIIPKMLWWHPQKIQLYFQMTAFLWVNNNVLAAVP